MNDQNTPKHKSYSANDLCDAGIAGFVRWQADAMEHIDAAIACDSDFALPRLVKAWMLQSARDASFSSTISELILEVEQSLKPTEARESTLCRALKFSYSGHGIESANALEELLTKSPTDLLGQQLIQEELFWLGNAAWMYRVTESTAPAWHETTEGYGSFLSLRAFSNEEAGYLDQAERFGRMAVELDQTDIWGAHAVAHALLMKGQMQRGIDWLENLSSNWGHGNQMRHHLWWHLCLFALEHGDFDRILDLLTKEIRNPDSSLVKSAPAAGIDISNFASLLIRLELYGVDVGDHWDILASVCAERVNNHGNAFGNIHDMMVLAATGQTKLAEEMLRSMHARYHEQPGSHALSYNAVGIPACEAMLAHRRKDYKQVLEILGSIRHELHLMGASHAQRDVFFHLLVHAAEQEGRDDLRAVFIDDIKRIGFCEVPSRAAYKQSRH